MDKLEILKSGRSYAGRNLELPVQWKANARQLCWEYNQLPPDREERRREILTLLLGTCHPLTFIEPAFRCDYGFNIHTHGLAVINYNCVILDKMCIRDRGPGGICAGALCGPGAGPDPR